MRVVVALGGNALLERGERPDATVQRHHVRDAARALAALAAEHEVVLTHGNGPQVGMLAIESEADPALTMPYPLDALVAQTQGMIGYWLAQELRNVGVARPIACLITQTLVDAADPAFARPSKFVGPTYSHRQAHLLARRHGWAIAEDGDAWRRVVPSPMPTGVVEAPAIRHLLGGGIVVICSGGGGVPVAETDDGQRHGVDAVVDKDAATAMLAADLQADAMLLLTDVPAVMRSFHTAHPEPIPLLDTRTARAMSFPAGSMQPKVDACIHFTESTGGVAAIGRLTDAAAVLAGTAGTRIVAAAHAGAGGAR